MFCGASWLLELVCRVWGTSLRSVPAVLRLVQPGRTQTVCNPYYVGREAYFGLDWWFGLIQTGQQGSGLILLLNHNVYNILCLYSRHISTVQFLMFSLFQLHLIRPLVRQIVTPFDWWNQSKYFWAWSKATPSLMWSYASASSTLLIQFVINGDFCVELAFICIMVETELQMHPCLFYHHHYDESCIPLIHSWVDEFYLELWNHNKF